MLTSLGLVLLLGMALGALAKRLKLPSLVGMLIAGMILGPYALNLLSDSLLNISADLRQLALIIILTRAGLSLDVEALKRVGRPAILMCFVPACFEILGMTLLAPALLGVSTLDAAIMGAVVGAVSPAVIVPRMIRLSEEGWGVDRGIPQLILAGASVDDVFVIVMFTAFTGLASGGTGLTAGAVLSIPASILTGVAAGLLLGWLLAQWFRRVHMRDSVKVVILLSLAFLLVAAEDALEGIFPFSGLLSVMGAGVGLQRWRSVVAQRLSLKFSKLWVAAEVALFVLVGAAVDLRYALSAGVMAILAVLGALCFRAVGVLCASAALISAPKRSSSVCWAISPKPPSRLPLAVYLWLWVWAADRSYSPWRSSPFWSPLLWAPWPSTAAIPSFSPSVLPNDANRPRHSVPGPVFYGYVSVSLIAQN